MKRKYMHQGRSDHELFTVKCTVCGSEFLAGNPKAQFCSKECRPDIDRSKYLKRTLLTADCIVLPCGIEYRNDLMGRVAVYG